MRLSLLLLAFTGLVFAGCIDEQEPDGEPAEPANHWIDGFIVDDNYRPIQEFTATVVETGHSEEFYNGEFKLPVPIEYTAATIRLEAEGYDDGTCYWTLDDGVDCPRGESLRPVDV